MAAASIGDLAAEPSRARLPEDTRTGTRTATEAAAQTIAVDVRGAMARVTVTRQLPPIRQGELILDLALPDHSALLDVQLEGGGRKHPVNIISRAAARDTYLAALRGMGLSAGEAAFDDDATHRIRIAERQGNNNHTFQSITYRFSTVLEVRSDRYTVAFPAPPELNPPAVSRVDVRVAAGHDAGQVSIAGALRSLPRGGTATVSETVATGRRWLLSLLRAESARGSRSAPVVAGVASFARARSTGAGTPGTLMAYALSARGTEPGELPAQVLFVVDRSRSVGPAGLAAERDVARLLLEQLPPSTRFDALYFDRGTARLFPVPRTATREAIQMLDDHSVPALLGNGTDLAGALRAAGDLIRREASTLGPSVLLVLLTDGAVGRVAGGRLAPLVGATPGVELLAAVISVRPDEDPPVSPEERRLLRSLPAELSLGGIEREVRVSAIGDAVPQAIADLARGGDVYGLAVRGSRQRAGAPVLADVLSPGQGASGVVKIDGARFSVTARGKTHAIAPHMVVVDEGWLGPHLAANKDQVRVWSSPSSGTAATGTVAMFEPVLRLAPGEPADSVRGFMERSVVRDALSLAFTPRARACYLNRSGATPADRALTGRVRLAIDLVRGEVGAARIESSTLARPEIETCLKNAAFALDVPRAYRNDEPVTAILNLVFKPRTPEKAATLAGTAVGDEIDLLVDEALRDGSTAARPPDSPASSASPAGAEPAPPPPAIAPRAGTPESAIP